MSFTERLRIVFEGVTGQASSSIRGVGDDLDKTKKKSVALGADHKSSMDRFAKATVAGFGVQQIVQFATQILDVGTKLEAMNAKAETVFGGQIDRVKDWASENAAAMGLTQSAAVGAGAGIADLLKPMGFTERAATDQTLALLDLSAALSAWSGGQRSSAEVSEILTKAMLGEREQLKSLGISITEAEVSARLLEKGQTKLTGAALAQAKALATQQLIMEKSVDAQKAWADGSMDSTKEANEARAAMAEMAETLVRELVPVLQDLLPIISDVVGALADLVGGIQAVVGALDFMGPAIDIQLLKDFKDGLSAAATSTVELGDGAKEAHVEALKLAEGEAEAAREAGNLKRDIDSAKTALKQFRDELDDDKSLVDLEIELRDAAEALKELDPLEAESKMLGFKQSIADVAEGLGNIPPETVMAITAKFDGTNYEQIIALLERASAFKDAKIDISATGPVGTADMLERKLDIGVVNVYSTQKLTPNEVAALITEWQRRNGRQGGPF